MGSAKLPLDVLVEVGRAVNVAFVVFVQGAASIAIIRNKSRVATDTAFEEHMLGLTVPVHQAASIGAVKILQYEGLFNLSRRMTDLGILDH